MANFKRRSTSADSSARSSAKFEPARVAALCARLFAGKYSIFLIPALLFIAFFLPSFSPNTRFSYRDVAFYYYPLFQQIQNEWNRGRLPLWNPNVNLGQPLAADPTASVFYPGKIVFFLSNINILSFATCFKLYVWIHIALMFILAYRLARRLRVSASGAAFSALVYAFSGQTLFQYSNVIYLVGAAWAPALFIYSVDFFRAPTFSGKTRALLKLSVVQSITVLGGEPQIVYLALLTSVIAGLFASTRTTNEENARQKDGFHISDYPSSSATFPSSIRAKRVLSSVIFIAATSAVTFCLAAIQILPSLELIDNSSRVFQEKPRSLWEIPSALSNAGETQTEKKVSLTDREFYDELLCADFSNEGRSRSVYRFSVGPWRWLEFLYPNVGGRQFPQSSRWFRVFPEEIAVWTPTLYFGAFPFLLALSAFLFRRKRRDESSFFRCAATYLTAGSILAAMGGYGAVWLFRSVSALASGSSIPVSFSNYDPVGGVYWALNIIVPKFAEFRYPAKLLTLSMLGFSYLVGYGWDRKKFSRGFLTALTVASGLSFIAWAIACLGAQSFLQSINTTDFLFGPFQPETARRDLCNAFLHTAVILFLAVLVLASFRKKIVGGSVSPTQMKTLPTCLLLLAAADVYHANSWTVVVSPAPLFNRTSQFTDRIENDRTKNKLQIQPDNTEDSHAGPNACFTAIPPTRIYRFPVWFPPVFSEKSSARRNTERVVWDVETLYPLYPSKMNVAITDVRGAVSEYRYERFCNALLNRANVGADLSFLGVEYVLGPKFWIERILDAERRPPSSLDLLDWGVSLKKIDGPVTRAALFRQQNRVDSIYLNHVSSSADGIKGQNDFVVTVSYEPNRVVYLASASEPSDVVFSEQFWSDWSVRAIPVTSDDGRIFLANRFNAPKVDALIKKAVLRKGIKIDEKPIVPAFEFLRKTSIPQGLYCLDVRYAPKRLALGAALSVLSWCALLGFCLIGFVRKKALRIKKIQVDAFKRDTDRLRTR